MRFSLKTLLLIPVIASVAYVASQNALKRMLQNHERIELQLDVEFEEQLTIPAWLEATLPASTSAQFYRIVELDILFDDLSNVHPERIESYHGCEFVRTLRIHNLTLPKSVLKALLGFPRLEKIVVPPHHYPYYGSDAVDLSRCKLNSVEIIVGQ